MMVYVGTLVVGHELIQVAYMGRVGRYVSTAPSGSVQVVDEKLEGSMPMHLETIRHLLQAMPPGMECFPVHPGVRGGDFFCDVQACKDALVLENQD